MVLNGEIYNFRELRAELERRSHSFYTRTDTEVIAHLYEERGPDLVEDLNGMFAFAVWDERRQRLLLGVTASERSRSSTRRAMAGSASPRSCPP